MKLINNIFLFVIMFVGTVAFLYLCQLADRAMGIS